MYEIKSESEEELESKLNDYFNNYDSFCGLFRDYYTEKILHTFKMYIETTDILLVSYKEVLKPNTNKYLLSNLISSKHEIQRIEQNRKKYNEIINDIIYSTPNNSEIDLK